MKKLAVAAVITVMAVGAFTGCSGSGADIGRDAALEAALNDAGVSESDTSRLKVSEDSDDGRKIYEISFDANQTEYDYEIQASDGSILSAETEQIQNAGTADNGTQNSADQGQTTAQDSSQADSGTSQSQQNSQTAEPAVSIDEATRIALDRVEGAAESDIRIELDRDDGRMMYEGDIIYNQIEYDFKIDANTGEVIEWSEERA